MSEPILVARDGDVAIVTLNRPDKRNALIMDLRRKLLDAAEALSGDATCRAIVLHGAGGAFCSGGDIAGMRSDDPLAARARLAMMHQIVRVLGAGPKPVVAAVEGAAFGAGLSLALTADVIVAGPRTRFCASFLRIGLMPDGGLLWSLDKRVGLGHAKRMLMETAVVEGPEALAIGLADELAETDAAVLPSAIARARRLAAQPPVAMALIRAGLDRAKDGLDAVMALELDGQALLYTTQDHQEGREAFLNKRPPSFTGL